MATDSSPRNPDQEQRNCNPGWAHLPRWSRASTGPRRHGRRGLGAEGASGPVSELRDLPPQRCPRTGIRPFPPPATGALASQPRLHPAARAPTLLLGRCAGPLAQADCGLYHRCRRRRRCGSTSKPLVFVLSCRRPQGGGARDSPRRDPPLPQQTWKKSSAPKHLSPVSFVASSTRLLPC